MKHYVLGFIFNKTKDRVLLIEKKKPEWQDGYWNGIGGKLEPDDDNPLSAMYRETNEEIGYIYNWEHCITFICPGGTVFVFRAISHDEEIMFEQLEIEQLADFPIDSLPKVMNNLKWIIPICLSTIQFPILIPDTTLGITASEIL